MAYLERLLSPGERVRVIGRQHWVALVFRLAWRVIQVGLVFAIVRAAQAEIVARILATAPLDALGPGGQPLPLADWTARIAFWALVAVLLLAAFDFLRWKVTEFVLTDQRLLRLEGVINRASLDSPLDRVDDVLLVQSWLGQRLDYGDLAIVRAGQETGHLMPSIADPLRFKQAMMAAREARWKAFATAPGVARRDEAEKTRPHLTRRPAG